MDKTSEHDDNESRILEQDLIKNVSNYVESYMSNFDASHDWRHILRVVGLAKQIVHAERINNSTKIYELNIVILCALLHDVGDRKYLKEGQDSKTLVRDVLRHFGAAIDVAERVQEICTNVSYSSEIKNPGYVLAVIARYPELAVVQDADRLDAIGAVGIGRCFTYGGALSGKAQSTPALLKDASDGRGMNHTMEHFDEKLVRLESMMKTATGREMAIERTQRLRQFMAWWDDEIGIEQTGNEVLA